MIRKWLLFTFLLLIVLVVGRVYLYHQWITRVTMGGTQRLVIQISQLPKRQWSGVTVVDRGLAWVCPQSETDCRTVRELNLGDRVWVEVQGDQHQKQVGGTIKRVVKVVPVKATPVITYWWWIKILGNWRNQIDNYYRLSLGEPYAGLLSGIVLGTNNQMDQGLYTALVRTGTMHVVAASGFNITLVAGALMGLAIWRLKRRWAIGVTMIGIIGYVLVAGAGPAVIRAGIMGGLALVAQLYGKAYTAAWALVLSALVMLLLAPWLLVNVSFQLSIAATAGLVWGSEKIARLIGGPVNRVSGKNKDLGKGVIESLSTTLAATLATLPITLVAFGQMSLIAPLVNVLILWLVPPMMVVGGLGALIAMIWLPLGRIVVWLSWPLIYAFVQGVTVGSSVPWALMNLPGVTWLVGLGWWCLLGGWWLTGRQANRDSAR